MGLSPGNTALVRFYVHQNDVRTDPADAIPGDNKVVPATPKTEMPAGSRDDNGGDPALRQLDLGIGNKAQPPPVTYTDNFLAVQVCKFA